MEATGVYWKPVYYVLEERFECWLLNAQHLRNVRSRKTDVQDAQWITGLIEHGLVRPELRAAAADPRAARSDPLLARASEIGPPRMRVLPARDDGREEDRPGEEATPHPRADHPQAARGGADAGRGLRASGGGQGARGLQYTDEGLMIAFVSNPENKVLPPGGSPPENDRNPAERLPGTPGRRRRLS